MEQFLGLEGLLLIKESTESSNINPVRVALFNWANKLFSAKKL